MKTFLRVRIQPSLALGGVILMLLATTAVTRAASGTWTNLNNGTWSAATNWLNGIVADGVGNTADFSTLDLQAPVVVTLDTPRTIGNITFGDVDPTNTPNGWIVSNGGVAANSLTLSNTTATPLFTVNPIHFADGINNSNDVVFGAVITGQQGWTKKGFGCLTPQIANAVNLAGPVQIDEGLIDLQTPSALAQGRNLIFNGGALAGSVTAQPVTLTNIILTTGTEISSNSYTATRVNFGAVPFIGGPASVLRIAINEEFVTGGTLPGGSNCFANFSGTIDFGGSGSNWRQDPGNGGGIFGSKKATFNLGTNNAFINSRAATAGAFHTHYLGALIGGPRTQLRGSQQTANALVIYQIGDANLDTTFDGTIRDGAVGGGAGTFLVKSGTGKLTLTGTNTYSGTTVINGGTLVLGATELMNSTASITVNSNATLDVSAFNGWANLLQTQSLAGFGVVTGSVVVAAGTVSPGVGTNIGQLKFAGDYTVTGTMTNLFKMGSGTNDSLLVSGNLSLSNLAATIRVMPTGSVINNGTYPLIQWTGALTGDTNNVVLSFPPQPGTLTLVTNLVAKTISLVVSGASVNNLTWSGNVSANNWDHSTHNWNSGALPFTDLDNVTFNDSGVASVPVNILEDVRAGAFSVNNTNKDYIFNSSGGTLTGGNGLTKGGPGKLTLIGTDNTYAGSTTVNAGTLQIGDGVNSGMVGAGSINDNGTVIFNRPSGFDLTLGAQILGSGTLVQNGANTLTLTANNSFSGNTVINAGTLQLGDGNSANGSIGGTVSNNATLGYFYNNTANINNSFVGTGVVNFNVNGAARQFNLGATPTSLTNNGFSGTINVGPLVALHVPDGANGTNQLGYGSTVIVQSTAQLTLDRGSYCNSSISLSGFGNGSGVTANMAMDMAQGAVLAGNVTLAADASIGGFLGGVTISGRILGMAGTETLTFRNTRANATSINIFLGSTNGPNSWGPTIIDPGDNLNQIIRVTEMVNNALSTNALTINAHGALQLNGNNQTVASLTGGSPDGSFNATILNSSTTNSSILTVGTDDTSTTFGGIFGDGGPQPLGLTKVGAGILTIGGVNTNTGTVAVKGGTLYLSEPASFTNAAVITIGSGATFDVTGRSDQTLTLGANQTLKGSGTNNGNVIGSLGSTINPGDTIGSLNISGNLSLGGTLLMELNRASSPASNDTVNVTGTLTTGGVLAVTNVGPALHVGDSFQLFSTGTGGFGSVNLQTNDYVNNVKYTWTDTLNSDGKIKVATVGSLVNATPTNIIVSVNGGNLALSWPVNHTGWTLQAQTNSLSTGLGTNWVSIPGSTSTNQVVVPINTGNGSVFFRMILL